MKRNLKSGKRTYKLTESEKISNSVGIIGIHLKQIGIYETDDVLKFCMDPLLSDKQDLLFYLKIICQHQIKYSHIYRIKTSNKLKFLVLDEIKHFDVSLDQDSWQSFRFELICLKRLTERDHSLFAWKEAPNVFEIMNNQKARYLLDLSDKFVKIADLEVEFCFSYGRFGFSNSSLMKPQGNFKMSSLVQKTMFKAESVDESREDFRAPGNILLPLNYPLPIFIRNDCRYNINDPLQSEMKKEKNYSSNYPLVNEFLTEQLPNLINSMRALSNRQERLVFLERQTIKRREDELLSSNVVTAETVKSSGFVNLNTVRLPTDLKIVKLETFKNSRIAVFMDNHSKEYNETFKSGLSPKKNKSAFPSAIKLIAAKNMFLKKIRQKQPIKQTSNVKSNIGQQNEEKEKSND